MSQANAAVSELRLPSPPQAPNITLRAAYDADRAARDATNPTSSDPNRCRYCGKRWFRFGGAQFDGHVTCVVSPEFQRVLVELLDTSISYASIGIQLGVKPNIVRAWWRAVKWSP